MNVPLLRLSVMLLAGVVQPAAAITVSECVDASGASFWTEVCPPDTEKKADKKLPGKERAPPTELEVVATANPVTLYAAPGCDACDLIRLQLRRRFVPFRDVDVTRDANLQAELRRAAGSLTVPAVSVGQTVLLGYDKNALNDTLTQAGYPAPDPGSPAAGSTGTAAGVEGAAPADGTSTTQVDGMGEVSEGEESGSGVALPADGLEPPGDAGAAPAEAGAAPQ